MNLQLLKSSGFYISLLGTLAALLVNQGIVGSGSVPYQVLSYLIGILGIVTGHTVASGTAITIPAKV